MINALTVKSIYASVITCITIRHVAIVWTEMTIKWFVLYCKFRLCRTLRDTFVPNVRQKFCFPLKVTFEHFCYFYFIIT